MVGKMGLGGCELLSCSGIIHLISFGYYASHGLPQSQSSLDCTAQIWAIKGLGRYAVVFNSKATHTIQEGTIFRRLLEQTVATEPVIKARITHGYDW
jgi:hypothetical protein